MPPEEEAVEESQDQESSGGDQAFHRLESELLDAMQAADDGISDDDAEESGDSESEESTGEATVSNEGYASLRADVNKILGILEQQGQAQYEDEDDDEDIAEVESYDIGHEVPDEYEAMKAPLNAVGKRAEEQIRSLRREMKQERQERRAREIALDARMFRRDFKLDRKTEKQFTEFCGSMGLRPQNYEQLADAWDRWEGQRAKDELARIKSGEDPKREKQKKVKEKKEKATGSPRFVPKNAAAKKDSPDEGKMEFDEGFDRALKQANQLRRAGQI